MAGHGPQFRHDAGVDYIAVMRNLLFAILAFSIAGTGTELLLLGHTESVQQLIPVIGLGIGLLATGVVALRPTRATVLGFRTLMAAFIVAGLLGLYYHYSGNAEFELERRPALRGLALLWEALRGATPALAPGAMVQLGLLGIAATYRHPRLQPQDSTAAGARP